MKSGENAGPAGAADGGGAEVVGEANAGGCNAVYVGRLENRVSSASQKIGALIVSEQE